MRILHVTTFLQGGAGRVIADLAIQQEQAGHEAIVVSDSGGEAGYASYPEYVQALAAAGVETHTTRSTFTRDVALNVDAAGHLRRLIGNRHIDVIHAHAAIPAMLARLAMGSRPTHIVVTMHGWGIAKSVEQARADVTLLGLVDAVVTPSIVLRDRLRRLGVAQDHLHVVPYGIGPVLQEPIEGADLEAIETIRRQGASLAMCIGTIGERKNQRLLVKALAQEGLEHVHAVFVGDGDVSPLASEAVRLDVQGRTHIFGYRRAASRYLRQADFAVLPSQDEGLPLVLLEALRDGVPVVASDIPEMVEALDGGRLGHLCSGGSAPALAGAMRCALTTPAREREMWFARSRLYWEQHHALERMTAAYARMYASLIHAAGSAMRQPA